MDGQPLIGQVHAQGLGHRERGGLGDRVGGTERRGSDTCERMNVDNRGATGQQRQKCLYHGARAVEVDGELLLEDRLIAEVVERRHTGVVDENVQ